MSAATVAATSASISTPVCAVVSATAVISTTLARRLELDVDRGQRKRMAERDQLARPLRSHDPGELRRRERVALRQVRSRRAVSGAMRTLARATARGADSGLRADVDHVHAARLVDVRELAHRHPVRRIARPDHAGIVSRVAAAGHAPPTPRRASSCAIQRARSCSRTCARIASRAPPPRRRGIVSASWSASACPSTSNGLTVDRPLAELLVRARVLGEDEHAVALVDERRLLRDEVEPVEDRVHEQDVELLVRRHGLREVVLDPQLERLPALGAKRSLTSRAARWIAPRYSAYSGMSCREGSSSASIRTRPSELGMRVEEELERLEAAHDVLRRVGAVDAHDELLGPRPRSAGLGLEHLGSAASLVELVRVDRDRVPRDERRPAPVRGTTSSWSRSPPTMSSHERRKFRRQRSVWKPTTSFASSPSCTRLADRRGSTRQ